VVEHRRRQHQPVDVAQRAAHPAQRRRLVLEVELVERGLAQGAQRRACIQPSEHLPQRRGERVEQRQVAARRRLQPGAAHLHRHRATVLRAATVHLTDRGDRDRLSVQLVQDPARRLAPRLLEDPGDVTHRQRPGGLVARPPELHGQVGERGRQRVGGDNVGGAAERDAAAGGAPHERGAGVQQCAQGGRRADRG